jgi:hypothetical protein
MRGIMPGVSVFAAATNHRLREDTTAL